MLATPASAGDVRVRDGVSSHTRLAFDGAFRIDSFCAGANEGRGADLADGSVDSGWNFKASVYNRLILFSLLCCSVICVHWSMVLTTALDKSRLLSLDRCSARGSLHYRALRAIQ